jgi:CheY-like chemotaxis protein
MLEEEVDRARQRASQIERLRALGELAAGVAHDFNNALETVLGRVTLARDKLRRGDDIAEDLDIIEGAARNGADTVQRVCEFSRPTGSDTWHDVNLTEVVRDAASFVQTRVPPGIELEIEVDETPPIRGNGAELREVVLNLLSNALDAVDGSGRVRVRSFTRTDQAVIEVEDNGCGMAPDVQRRVFEPFFSTKGESGTGLGLSVSHGILRRHDAQVLLKSAPGEGTQFCLVFAPLEPVTQSRPPLADGAKAIAVVDDDPSVGSLMQDMLGEMGHSVTVLTNVNDTLSFLAGNHVDLLITDLDLDGMSGWHLARSVRQIQPHVVVGLITGWPLGATDDELKTRGVDFVLPKPFSIDALTRALHRVSSD